MRAQTRAAAMSVRLSSLRMACMLVLFRTRRAVKERCKARGRSGPATLVCLLAVPMTLYIDRCETCPLCPPRNSVCSLGTPVSECRLNLLCFVPRHAATVWYVQSFNGISCRPEFPFTSCVTRLLRLTLLRPVLAVLEMW